MPRFLRLPSGLVLNLYLVRRVVPAQPLGSGALTVYFADNDFTSLDPADSEALQRYLRVSSRSAAISSNWRVAVFWCIIAIGIILVWVVVRH